MAFLQRVERAADALKVFPLPSAVLLPGSSLPLHVFEPRYRALVRDCLATDRVMALAQLRPGWESNYGGRPPLEPLACAGAVIWHEDLPDGRSNIVLQGVARVRILDELPARELYREVRAEVLRETPYRGELEEVLQRAVLEIAARVQGEVGQELLHLAASSTGGRLADAVAAALVAEPVRRQAVLAEIDPEARLKLVLDGVEELIARIGALAPRGLVH